METKEPYRNIGAAERLVIQDNIFFFENESSFSPSDGIQNAFPLRGNYRQDGNVDSVKFICMATSALNGFGRKINYASFITKAAPCASL